MTSYEFLWIPFFNRESLWCRQEALECPCALSHRPNHRPFNLFHASNIALCHLQSTPQDEPARLQLAHLLNLARAKGPRRVEHLPREPADWPARPIHRLHSGSHPATTNRRRQGENPRLPQDTSAINKSMPQHSPLSSSYHSPGTKLNSCMLAHHIIQTWQGPWGRVGQSISPSATNRQASERHIHRFHSGTAMRRGIASGKARTPG